MRLCSKWLEHRTISYTKLVRFDCPGGAKNYSEKNCGEVVKSSSFQNCPRCSLHSFRTRRTKNRQLNQRKGLVLNVMAIIAGRRRALI